MRNWLIMIVLLIAPLLLAPVAGSLYPAMVIPAEADAAYMETTATGGFTIFQRQQVQPQYITIMDATGSMTIQNPEPAPGYPATFGTKICYSRPFNIYSPNDNERVEVWQDSAGTATVEDILTVCPQFTR